MAMGMMNAPQPIATSQAPGLPPPARVPPVAPMAPVAPMPPAPMAPAPPLTSQEMMPQIAGAIVVAAPPGPPGPPGGAAANNQPFRQLKVEDALAYLDQVKMKFEKQPHIYNKVRAKSAAGLRLIRPAPRGDARASRAPNLPAHAAANTRIRPPPQFPPSVSSLFR